MAWRISQSVIRGEIDNREKGKVAGRIWVLGREEPIELRLSGNCWRDLAGAMVSFTNPHPQPGDHLGLSILQQGRVGDITASRKVRDVPLEDIERLAREKGRIEADRYPLVNSLYIEWFSKANGRVVIETTRFHVELGTPAWTMTPEEERQQGAANHEAICNWMEDLSEAVDAASQQEIGDEKPMNEFQWEQFMKESDATAEKFGQLFEKYIDHPDRERIISREMGWSWIEDMLDAEEEEEDGPADMPDVDLDDPPELVPNPLTEGVDWVRNKHGHVEHPLVLHAHDLGLDMWRHAQARGLVEEKRDQDVAEMIFKTQTTAAKLAGALNHLAYDEDPDAGFVVAALKRAVNYLHEAIAAANKPGVETCLATPEVNRYRRGLFDLRQEILALMTRFRQAH